MSFGSFLSKLGQGIVNEIPVIGPAAASLLGGSMAQESSARSAQRQMDFQERMSDTEITRRVADLKQAGLNPALAYTQGGASSPGGSSFQGSDVVTPAVNSAISARNSRAQMDLVAQQAGLVRSQSAAAHADALDKIFSLGARWNLGSYNDPVTGSGVDFDSPAFESVKSSAAWKAAQLSSDQIHAQIQSLLAGASIAPSSISNNSASAALSRQRATEMEPLTEFIKFLMPMLQNGLNNARHSTLYQLFAR